MGNSFVCNCHLTWLGSWLKEKALVTGNPSCSEPENLKDIPIQDVSSHQFTCHSRLFLSMKSYRTVSVYLRSEDFTV